MNIYLSAFVPDNLVSRDGFGSPVPRQPAHLNTQAESGAYLRIPPEFRGGVHLFIYNRHTPSGQSRVYRVTQLRTDGVHCRESAGTGPVILKVVPNECCLGKVTMEQLIFASISHTRYWYEVGMLKVPAVHICCTWLFIVDSVTQGTQCHWGTQLNPHKVETSYLVPSQVPKGLTCSRPKLTC